MSGKPRPSIDKLVAMLPTPMASDDKRTFDHGRPTLNSMLLPTPTVSGDWNRRGASQYSGDGLASVAGLSIRLREWMMGASESWTQVDDEKR